MDLSERSVDMTTARTVRTARRRAAIRRRARAPCHMDVLWKTQQISKFDEWGYGQITVQLEGVASFYLEGRQAFRNQAAKAQQQT
jgi:hypothetical protein